MSHTNHPAQIIVGDKNQAYAHVENLLQQALCKRTQNNPEELPGCYCNDCRKIKNHQHHNFVWITPEKDYTVDDIQIIFERARFALDPDQVFFFILDNAQTLTTATANRLLKILEEPPKGYHFILLTTNLETIVPTIVSRSLIVELSHSTQKIDTHDDHAIMAFFFGPTLQNDPFAFEQAVKKSALTDSASLELLQRMIARLAQQLHAEKDASKQERITRSLEFLLKKMRKPPQSGSSEIFWKHIFLSYPRC